MAHDGAVRGQAQNGRWAAPVLVLVLLFFQVVSSQDPPAFEFSVPSGCAGASCQYKVAGVVDGSSGRVNITFTTGQATDTWLGLGVSNDVLMANSDIVLVYWDGAKPVVTDRYATMYGVPPVDADQSQNVAFGGSQSGGVTTINVVRDCSTVNSQDISLQGTHYLLYAYGNVNNGRLQRHTYRMASASTFTIDCFIPSAQSSTTPQSTQSSTTQPPTTQPATT
eukprot:scpid99936/ scgid22682/ 